MDKVEIEKILKPLMCFECQKQHDDKLKLATSSLTALIIKWLEGKKVDIYKLKHGATVNNTWSEEGRNQLITELIGEVK